MSHFIKLTAARSMTRKFKEQQDTILGPDFRGKKILPTCESFDRAAIDRLLAQPGCTEIRIYYGMDDNLKIHAILVGVDSTGEHMLPSDPDEENEQIVEMSRRCPDNCPTNLL